MTRTGGGLLLLYAVLALADISHALPARIVIDRDAQFEFARTLMERADYEGAAGEFERLIHFFPEDPIVTEARFFMGMCYLLDTRYEDARELFRGIVASDPGGIMAGRGLFMTAESYFRQGLMKEAAFHFRQVAHAYPHHELKNAARYRLAWTLMREDRWQEASDAFLTVEEGSALYESSRALATESLGGETLRLHSPATAGSLAALVPGLGHAYLARYKDATVAFVLNALFVWAAVESFREEHHVLGGIVTFLEVGWYSGNIYSAVNSAHKQNRARKDAYRQGLHDDLDLRLFTSRNSGVGVMLTFRF